MVLLVCFVSFDTRCRFNFFNELSPLSIRIFLYFSAEAGANIKPFFHSWKTFTIVFLTPQKKPCQKHAKVPKNNGWKPKKILLKYTQQKNTWPLRFEMVPSTWKFSLAENQWPVEPEAKCSLSLSKVAEAEGSLRQAQWPVESEGSLLEKVPNHTKTNGSIAVGMERCCIKIVAGVGTVKMFPL